MENKVTVILNLVKRNISVDIEIPLDITVRELLIAMNYAFDLGIDTTDINQCYLKVENPIMLLRGNNPLSEWGLRNGSIINYTE